MTLKLGYPSPKHRREEPAYLEGKIAFNNGGSITENPYVGEVDPGAWNWSFGWQDALADQVRALKEER